MKAGIHPNYVEAIVKCACGETFKTRSTKPEIHLEICSKCHPFFTGKQKLVDTAGRVERFQNGAVPLMQLKENSFLGSSRTDTIPRIFWPRL